MANYSTSGQYKPPSTGFTAQQYKTGAAGASFIGTYMQGRSDKAAAAFDKFTGEQQARMLLANADARYAAGTREAREEVFQQDRMESDIVAAMAASGGTVDPVIIAKLKARTANNALSAVFQATVESEGMRMQAQQVKSAARMNYMNQKVSSANALMSSSMTFMGAYGG